MEGFPEVLAAGELKLFFDEQLDVGCQVGASVGFKVRVVVCCFFGFNNGFEVEVP